VLDATVPGVDAEKVTLSVEVPAILYSMVGKRHVEVLPYQCQLVIGFHCHHRSRNNERQSFDRQSLLNYLFFRMTLIPSLIIMPAILNDVRAGPQIHNRGFYVVTAKAITGGRKDFRFGQLEQIAFHDQGHFDVIRAAIIRGIPVDKVNRAALHGDFHLVTATEGILIIFGGQAGTRQTSAV
jgi:hypothetical protein